MEQVETDWQLRRAGTGLHLYVIFGVYTRRCKIGRATDVQRRLRALQSGSADTLVLWCWAKDCGDREPQLHDRFRKHRLHGEWFSPEVTALFAGRVPRQTEASALMARIVKKWTRVENPQCPGCGSQRKIATRIAGKRVVGYCPDCNRYRYFSPLPATRRGPR